MNLFLINYLIKSQTTEMKIVYNQSKISEIASDSTQIGKMKEPVSL